jgi:hypothetical protein
LRQTEGVSLAARPGKSEDAGRIYIECDFRKLLGGEAARFFGRLSREGRKLGTPVSRRF